MATFTSPPRNTAEGEGGPEDLPPVDDEAFARRLQHQFDSEDAASDAVPAAAAAAAAAAVTAEVVPAPLASEADAADATDATNEAKEGYEEPLHATTANIVVEAAAFDDEAFARRLQQELDDEDLARSLSPGRARRRQSRFASQQLVTCCNCSQVLAAPEGAAMFKCGSCGTELQSPIEQRRRQYEQASSSWRHRLLQVPCAHCGALLHLPPHVQRFQCCLCDGVSRRLDDGERLTFVRGDKDDCLFGSSAGLATGAVLGLTAGLLLTPWLFWPVFF